MNSRARFASPAVVILLTVSSLLSACTARLPDKHVVYFNDFESGNADNLTVYNHNGKVDTLKISAFNGGHVFGFFNNNLIEFAINNLPAHNTVKIEFDLLIHDKWDGDYLVPGGTVPDVWQMVLNGSPLYITTFSNGTHGQSFPRNYVSATAPSQPARANAENDVLPGVCALKAQANGSSLYKIEYQTGHTGSSISIACNDALQPFNSFCAKSWSIDNMRITVVNFN